MGYGAKAMKRCCGDSRQEGGIYVENGGGTAPLENFLLCPSKIVPEELGVSAVGTTVFTFPGDFLSTPHLADIIGKEHYRHPVLWLEETRYGGLSRKITEENAKKLKPESQIFIAHSQAYIYNYMHYRIKVTPCPRLKYDHDKISPPEFCIGLFWEDLIYDAKYMEKKRFGEDPLLDNLFDMKVMQEIEREYCIQATLPCGWKFYGFERDEDLEPEYAIAFFAVFPITRIVVVKAKDNSHKQRYEELKDVSNLCVDEVEE